MTLTKQSKSLLNKAALSLTACAILAACSPAKDTTHSTEQQTHQAAAVLVPEAEERLNIYKTVELTADISHLEPHQHEILSLLIDASVIMDNLFWQQSYHGKREHLLARIKEPAVKAFAAINYGPWDRLNNEAPFLQGYDEKPLGANFYPADMTRDEFNRFESSDKTSLYTVLRRNENGELYTIPYSEMYADELGKAAELLLQAADLTKNEDFKRYLTLRAEAFLSDDYTASDYAWMDMKDNLIDVIIGPIETYEDRLFGYKASFESYVLVKDTEWSERLAVYAETLPALQRNLPVPEAYKAEQPGSDGQLNAYDVVYYAGHSNAGSKTIAVNLPNDEAVQLAAGTRRSQLKNAMRAKFDGILEPIADVLIVPEQRQHITFDAFFANTMFHEVAHGLGIKNTLNGKGTVRAALREYASALEEGKADILGLYMVTQLLEEGILTEGQLEDYYVTFLAGIFRSVRFGASSAHGMANMIRFNYFEQEGAFVRNEQGQYAVDMEQMRKAVDSLSELILRLQGDGDYEGVGRLFEAKGHIGEMLQSDLDRIDAANIPVDVHFNQGKEVLGLN
ncbi:Zn-dependent hydrolase [Aliidiomarina taiwanensis]|uniref:Zn-dependent hydrolase n=1 Tax=Aliidiomarina taiwanensis TaxID=946228 RepID=A0A432X1D3_9GAMM|nr:Zn-dependent hydrolase [Aliidiomarina taiwanensis]RUO40093.1 Zn-dependent hydrolase [Aliidiomarina taiwanensis]